MSGTRIAGWWHGDTCWSGKRRCRARNAPARLHRPSSGGHPDMPAPPACCLLATTPQTPLPPRPNFQSRADGEEDMKQSRWFRGHSHRSSIGAPLQPKESRIEFVACIGIEEDIFVQQEGIRAPGGNNERRH